ncbi:hypothetical protein D6C93_09866 [Aureobasidium pullulans]|nr:hypothetical protein D6C93_09866 [Aureobasidium pullulans]
MSWSAAASPQEMIYPVPETRWNEINLKVQMLETLTWRLAILLSYSNLEAIFGSSIALLVVLVFVVWFRWDDINDWKRSVLGKKEPENEVTTERSSTKAVSPSGNIRKSSLRKATSPVLDTTQPYDLESELLDDDEFDSDWTVSEASEEDMSISDLDTED